MSLSSCIQKAGDFLSAKDKRTLEALANRYAAEGMPADKAQAAAVRAQLKIVEGLLGDEVAGDVSRSVDRSPYNESLRRGVVLDATPEETALSMALNDLNTEASAAYAEGRRAAHQIELEKMQALMAKTSDVDPKLATDLAWSMVRHHSGTGDKYDPETFAPFGPYMKLREQEMEMRKQIDALIRKRIGPPEFEGMRQLSDFPRAQTETPAFQSWFKGSKVVDKSGRPLIAFHGTNQDFGAFQTTFEKNEGKLSGDNWLGQLGTWFAAPSTGSEYDIGNAESTSEVFAEHRVKDDAFPEGAVIYPVFLAAKNPYELEGYDNILDERDEAGGGAKLRAKLISEGYDSIVIRDSDTDGGQFRDDWVMFHPEQIKSAIGNDGSFAADKKDIARSAARPNQLELAIEEAPDRLATMSAAQWKLWLDANASKFGVSKDGIADVKQHLTDLGKAKVTRDELAEYVRSVPMADKAREVENTPEFKKWFGDSIVTDTEETIRQGGHPQVMYHATHRGGFSEFDRLKTTEFRRPSMDTVGSWFSNNPSDDGGAGMYASGEGASIMPVYLRLARPKVYDAFREFLKDMHAAEGREIPGSTPGIGSTEGLRDKLKAQGYDGIAFMKTNNAEQMQEALEYRAAINVAKDEMWAAPKSERPFYAAKVKRMEESLQRLTDEINEVNPGRSTEFDKQVVYVAFDPEQIKSATGNDGNFDGNSPDITRSIGRDTALMDGYKVSDFLDSSKKVSWWDKTVGSPYHMAQNHPTFKRVYDAVQEFIGGVSKYATRAADMAPNILPKLENLRDITKSPLSAADVKALADPIFKGTLSFERDGNGDAVPTSDVGRAGVVWSDVELRDKWNLGAEQIALYREFRKATNKSIADMAVTQMVRLAGASGDGVRGRVLAAPTVKQAAEILADHLGWLAANDPTKANTLMNTARSVGELADTARGLMAKGYAPLSRFGDYTVYVTRNGGADQVYFGMYETEREANRAARAFSEDPHFAGAQVQTGTMSKEAHKLFKGVTPETLSLFGEALGLDENSSAQESQVFQEFLKLAKTNRSAMKHMIERKGIAGYSEDAGRVLASFIYSNARQASTNLHAGEIMKAQNDVPEGDLKDHAIKMVDYVNAAQDENNAMRGLLFANYIGGSAASAIINLTQSFTTTWPTLSQHYGIGRSGRELGAALGILKNGAGADTDLAEAMKRAAEEGITDPNETHQLQGQAAGRGSLQSGDGTALGDNLAKVKNSMAKLGLIWGKSFGLAESINRKIAFIAAYKLAREAGHPNPFEMAKKIVNDSQFVMNKGNNPVWARGPVGATLFTFKKFGVFYLENLARMWGNGPEGKKAFALSLAVMFVMGGGGGFPFEEDLENLIDAFMQRVLGKSFSSKLEKKQFFAKYLGDAGAEFIESGLSGLPGVPIDVSGRMGMGHLIPGSGLLTKKLDHTSDVTEIGGAAADFVKKFLTSAGNIAAGEPKQALVDVLPTAAANVVKMADMLDTGAYRDAKGRKVIDVTPTEAVLKGLGFQPRSVAQIQEASGIAQDLIGQAKIRTTEISDKWAKGRIDKRPELIEEAKAELKAWNDENPESKITISSTGINSRVKEANMDKAKRIAKAAPKGIKALVKDELASAQSN